MPGQVLVAGLIAWGITSGISWPLVILIVVFKGETEKLDKTIEMIKACHPFTNLLISLTPFKEKQ